MGPPRSSRWVIYLTERYGSHDRAVLASKVMLIDGERGSQLPYVAFGPSRARQRQHPHAQPSLQDRHRPDAPGYSSGFASRWPSDCSKPSPTRSTTSEPESATATRRRSDARSPRPPGWVLDSTDRSTARDDTTPNCRPSNGAALARLPDGKTASALPTFGDVAPYHRFAPSC